MFDFTNIEEAVNIAQNVDVALFLGLPESFESEG